MTEAEGFINEGMLGKTSALLNAVACSHPDHVWSVDKVLGGWAIKLSDRRLRNSNVAIALLPEGYTPEAFSYLKTLLEDWAAMALPPIQVITPP
ncbi:MAG: hypothetical protein NUW01_14285 [Gemmatimonadaceae bacterium]|nr:hypothetical protein [Gemmatimonadaceae bacterium]